MKGFLKFNAYICLLIILACLLVKHIFVAGKEINRHNVFDENNRSNKKREAYKKEIANIQKSKTDTNLKKNLNEGFHEISSKAKLKSKNNIKQIEHHKEIGAIEEKIKGTTEEKTGIKNKIKTKDKIKYDDTNFNNETNPYETNPNGANRNETDLDKTDLDKTDLDETDDDETYDDETDDDEIDVDKTDPDKTNTDEPNSDGTNGGDHQSGEMGEEEMDEMKRNVIERVKNLSEKKIKQFDCAKAIGLGGPRATEQCVNQCESNKSNCTTIECLYNSISEKECDLSWITAEMDCSKAIGKGDEYIASLCIGHCTYYATECEDIDCMKSKINDYWCDINHIV